MLEMCRKTKPWSEKNCRVTSCRFLLDGVSSCTFARSLLSSRAMKCVANLYLSSSILRIFGVASKRYHLQTSPMSNRSQLRKWHLLRQMLRSPWCNRRRRLKRRRLLLRTFQGTKSLRRRWRYRRQRHSLSQLSLQVWCRFTNRWTSLWWAL